jgi:hypothetical protein
MAAPLSLMFVLACAVYGRGLPRPRALNLARAQLRRHYLWRQHVFRSRSHLHDHGDPRSPEGLRGVGQGRASIQFKKRCETLHARFVATDGELAAIRAALGTQPFIVTTSPAPQFLAPILMVFTTSGATLVLSMWEPTMTPTLLPWPPFADGGAWKADTSIRMPRRF